MEIKIKVDAQPVLKELKNWSPERFMRAWVNAIKNLAVGKARAQASGKGGFWQREIAQSVQKEAHGDVGRVFSDSRIAQHVHSGGVIRPQRRKYLAIPIDKSVKGIYPEDYGGDLIFLRRKEDGLRGRAYLAKPMKTKVKPLWVLKKQVTQRPRPWWPTQEEAEAETVRFFAEDL